MNTFMPSPLAEGRELKWERRAVLRAFAASPLAEGRELKCVCYAVCKATGLGRPSRRGVN